MALRAPGAKPPRGLLISQAHPARPAMLHRVDPFAYPSPPVTVTKTGAPSLKVGLIALGCAKNLVDAEIMLGSLMKEGMQITNDPATADVVIVNTCSFIDSAQEESIDAILESAAVREARQRGQGLVVSGCMPQRYREELPKLLPEVDAFMGVDQVADVPRIVREALAHRAKRLEAVPASPRRKGKSVVKRLGQLDRASGGAEDHAPGQTLRGTPEFGRTRKVVAPVSAPTSEDPVVEIHSRPTFVPDFGTPRFRLTPRHFAYVKIAEGCNHPCSFCTIPRMRGSHRSRPESDVVAEARHLLADGVRELNLISQDSTYYGLDLRPKRAGSIAAPDRFTAAARSLPRGATTLCTLLRALNELEGDFWIRLLYTHPAHWTDELIETIAACPKVARYIDIPLQHIHPVMLERMRRETSRAYIEELIARIRKGIPGITIRTTFIVGFPGETAAMFKSLLEFIQTTRFERLGVFAYSKEDGTRAASMASQVPDAERLRRRDRAMAAQLEIARAVAASQLGREQNVLVEGPASGLAAVGPGISSWEHGLIRSGVPPQGFNPGSRSVMVARGEGDAPDIDGRVYVRGRLKAGSFARVRIVGHTDYDLLAEPV